VFLEIVETAAFAHCNTLEAILVAGHFERSSSDFFG
jgi:hypothetical protein